ncbi:MAG: type II toxin-antitoxin system RelE/ParE family toxin [Rhodobacteraceae bacterium]|nr:type II toxin-antitoxin system RelE/ParE family toxin [Paracoccaceae bacterium]
MSQPRYLPAALRVIGEIYDYSEDRFGENQADKYVQGLFALCEALAERRRQPIPDEFEVEGYFARYEKHFVYWRLSDQGEVIVVCILHHRMDLSDRLLDALVENDLE